MYSYRGNGSNNRMIYIVLILQILILTILLNTFSESHPLIVIYLSPSYEIYNNRLYVIK